MNGLKFGIVMIKVILDEILKSRYFINNVFIDKFFVEILFILRCFMIRYKYRYLVLVFEFVVFGIK